VVAFLGPARFTHVVEVIQTKPEGSSQLLYVLAIFHWFLASTSVLGLVFTIYSYGATLYVQRFRTEPAPPNFTSIYPIAPPAEMPFVHAVFCFLLLWGVASIGLNGLAAWKLQQARSRRFLLGLSVFNWFNVPLGTLLGVVTYVLLIGSLARKRFGTD
jgi:hypothetical protein